MDRRTHDSKMIGKTVSAIMREGFGDDPQAAAREYARAERCRICGPDNLVLPNARDVRKLIDRELLNNATYKAAVEAVEYLVGKWPDDQRPTYAAVRNHAKRHLKRDEAIVRTLMETHAHEDGIDVEHGEGTILSAGGVLAVIAQKGFQEIRDGRAVPTVAETIAASRAMNTIERERLLEERDEARREARLVKTILQDVASGATASVTTSAPELPAPPPELPAPPPELPAPARDELVVVPEADPDDQAAAEQRGFSCDECKRMVKSRGGLLQHKRRMHQETIPAR
jgi:hypothetical protein